MIRFILAALLLASPVTATPLAEDLAMPNPLVIAHRGASGERPEHTRAAYDLAIDQGADFIEPDLVMSRDGHLIVRHENEISETTDVAARPEFAARRTTKTIDGRPVTGWFTEDFTLAELRTLRARERLPALRPDSAAFDGQELILTFQDVVDIARAGSARTGRVIGVAPELKHPSYFVSIGLPMEPPLIAALVANALMATDSPVMIQCFEIDALRSLNQSTDAPLLQLMSPIGGPADHPDRTYAAMATPEGLAEIATYADAIGVETAMIVPRLASGAAGDPTPLVADAHAAGLKVIVWTFRAENTFLPTEFQAGEDHGLGDLGGWLRRFYRLGVDGVFTDHTEMAIASRE
ncbi:glycerophosphodiester phosphodiesterase [Brevundimonas aurifodinae]|uniref:glycerophosphodiester phosphodiesterase n=2 Tax=Brevundimonas TaxID=41275 RepID=A0ABV1NQ05_9CAUL|nr:MAG: glycerophosphodiester phosphodiesterase [Brevundimonas sp. 12-68-7]OYX32933.1 MAG: glycerophosphodiester phosphodiesterase [Brevundimonas subvibrioides]